MQALVKDRNITVKQSNFNSYIQNYLSYYGYTEPEPLYEQLDALSELDGESYALLSYAEHQAWYQIQSKINVVTE